jgi:HD superfamily phosphohydrolase
MGLAFLDFPGLTHSRLEHSIGVMHVADQLFQATRQNGRTPKAFDAARPGPVDPIRQAVRLAALFHDLGHPPFSHAVEATFKRFPALLESAAAVAPADERRLFSDYSHEQFTRWSIQKAIGDSEPLGKALVEELGDALALEIADLAIGKAKNLLKPYNQIISGEFDADRIDYLIRDNHRSGFVLGLSLDDIRDAIHMRDEKGVFEPYIDASALPFVNSVLFARQRLIRRVHLAPSGRIATQMLVNCLYHILAQNQPESQAELGKTIKWLHTRCTDYTFFMRLLEESKRFRSAEPLVRYYVECFETLTRYPMTHNLWRERTSIGFMEMHPCLRLLVHIVATSDWGSPQCLTFKLRDRYVFVEASTRPSQASDLLVDYGRSPHEGTTPGAVKPRRRSTREPSLDFIAATENRLGRAILVEAMSNLDVFCYELTARNPSRRKEAGAGAFQDLTGVAQLGATDGVHDTSKYCENLKGDAKNVGQSIAGLAHRIRSNWMKKDLGMIATDFLLTVLYALDEDVRANWHGAHGVYVYRSELFVTRFLPELNDRQDRASGDAPLFPSLFEKREHLGKRVFSQIQRLAAFGLILTRSNSMMNRERGKDTKATRAKVYSTREEIRINTWGRSYVEGEIEPELLGRISSTIRDKQGICRAAQMLLSDLYMALDRPEVGSSFADLDRLEGRRNDCAGDIHRLGGCAMTFSRAETEVLDATRLEARPGA